MGREENQLLPGGDVAMFINNRKLTRDLAEVVWYEVGKEKAPVYLPSHKDWTEKQFNEVDLRCLCIWEVNDRWSYGFPTCMGGIFPG